MNTYEQQNFRAKVDIGHELPAVAIDFETYYDKEVSIKTMGVWAYLHHPKCEAYLVTIYDGEQSFTGHPTDFDWPSLNGRLLVSHNAAFDKMVYDTLVEKGLIEPCDYAEWNCTASLAVFLRAPRNLKGAIEALYQKHVSKDYRAQALGKMPEDMIAEGTWDNVRQSNINDTISTWHLWTDNYHKWPARERRLSVMTYEQSHRGIPLNIPLIEEGISVMTDLCYEAASSLPWMKGLKPGDDQSGTTSIKAFREHCKKAGVNPPKSTSEDNLECIAWEKEHGDKIPWVGQMRTWRKANMMKKKLEVMYYRSNPSNNRFSYPQMYGGAHTLRWSGGSKDGTGESGFNPQNLPREPFHGVDMRRCLVASPGRKLIVADAAQIEPRCLAWLSGDQKQLDMIRTGLSVYEIHARNTMNWRGGELKREDKKLYQLAKIRVLGLGYGCGHKKFQVYAETQYQYVMTIKEAKTHVDDFRRKETKIVRLWNKLYNDMFRSALDCDHEKTWRGDPDLHVKLPSGELVPCHRIELPSGRELVYLYPRFTNKRGFFQAKELQKYHSGKSKPAVDVDDIDGKPEDLIAATVIGQPKTAIFYYGGLIAENVVQATARDVFGEMLIRVEDTFGKHLDVLFTSHDEMILDADPGISPKEIEEVMSISPDWMPDCPFGAEAVESEYYLK